jgi:hypothetical protein
LIVNQSYEIVLPVTAKKRLIETTVSPSTLRRLDALARTMGHSRSGYLRHLIEVHVRALRPKLLASLLKTKQDVIEDREDVLAEIAPTELITPRVSSRRTLG